MIKIDRQTNKQTNKHTYALLYIDFVSRPLAISSILHNKVTTPDSIVL